MSDANTEKTADPTAESVPDAAARRLDHAPARAAGTLVTRQVAADLLGISKTELRRREKELRPIVDARGHHLFEVEQLRTITTRRRVATASRDDSSAYDAETAADVFALLDDGVSTIEIVKRMRVHPSIVEAIHAQWARMRGAVVVRRKEIADWIALAIPETRQPDATLTADTIVTNVRDLALELVNRRKRACCLCGVSSVTVCGECFAVDSVDRRRGEAARAAGRQQMNEDREWSRQLRDERRPGKAG